MVKIECRGQLKHALTPQWNLDTVFLGTEGGKQTEANKQVKAGERLSYYGLSPIKPVVLDIMLCSLSRMELKCSFFCLMFVAVY